MKKWDLGMKDVISNVEGYRLLTGSSTSRLVNNTGEDDGAVIGRILHESIHRKDKNRFYAKYIESHPVVLNASTSDGTKRKKQSVDSLKSDNERRIFNKKKKVEKKSSRHNTSNFAPVNALDAISTFYSSNTSSCSEEENTVSPKKVPDVMMDPFNLEGKLSNIDTSSNDGEENPEYSEKTIEVSGNLLTGLRCGKYSGQCGNLNHLTGHCTKNTKISSSGPFYTKILREYYHKCKIMNGYPVKRCALCGNTSNLVGCLDCSQFFCDGIGHITQHLNEHPDHERLYSLKLNRQVKCANPKCEEMSGYKLIQCMDCFNKLFQRHYNMMSATWKRRGLENIINAVACDEHYHWHRVNCKHSSSSFSFPVLDRERLENEAPMQLSEYLF